MEAKAEDRAETRDLSGKDFHSVTIYNHALSEMADLETVSKLTRVCPQSNVQFGFLTMREKSQALG
ncbi:hypothetical protein MC885_014419 [Smutsia gigantea]|nr:hypothetical protein MC885_014419 [Smutsia gigantea]